MRIADKTPYRNKDGKISLIGQVQGTLENGLSWYPQVTAQDTVVDILTNLLDRDFILLRNFILPNTDLLIPMLLIGPSGVYLLSALPQRGSFTVRDDEWGNEIRGSFVPRGKLIKTIIILGRVIKLYLTRNNFKDEVVIEPVVIAANPALRIAPVHAAVRVVNNNEIESFARTIKQARPVFTSEKVADLALLLIKGPQKPEAVTPEQGALTAASVPAGSQLREALIPSESPAQEQNAIFSRNTQAFDFDDQPQDEESPAREPTAIISKTNRGFAFDEPRQAEEPPAREQTAIISKNNRALPFDDQRPPEEPRAQELTAVVVKKTKRRSYDEQPPDEQPAPKQSASRSLLLASTADPSQSSQSSAFESFDTNFDSFIGQADQPAAPSQTDQPAADMVDDSIQPPTESASQPAQSTPPKVSLFGFTRPQLLILVGLLIFWLLLLAAFFALVSQP